MRNQQKIIIIVYFKKCLRIQNCLNSQNTKRMTKFGPKKFVKISDYEKSTKLFFTAYSVISTLVEISS